MEGCQNKEQVGHNVCCKHGALVRHTIYNHEGCKRHAIRGGRYARHLEVRCNVEGCINKKKNELGLCFRHRGGICTAEGCTHNAMSRGVCNRNGATKKWIKCTVEGCTKQAERCGMCTACSAVEGCGNLVAQINRTYCRAH